MCVRVCVCGGCRGGRWLAWAVAEAAGAGRGRGGGWLGQTLGGGGLGYRLGFPVFGADYPALLDALFPGARWSQLS